jgi:bifunctional non-homologous end joining protein LigD
MSQYAFGFGDPCLPTRAPVAPSGSMWVHEIKHDGYRLMVRRTDSSIRISTRRGYDWTDRFGRIIEAANKLRATSFVIDGEGVILRPDGVSDLDRLRENREFRCDLPARVALMSQLRQRPNACVGSHASR